MLQYTGTELWRCI